MRFAAACFVFFLLLFKLTGDDKIVLLDTAGGACFQQFFSNVFSEKKSRALPENMDIEIRHIDRKDLKITDNFSVIADEGLYEFDRTGFKVLNYAVLPLIFAVDANNPQENISLEDLRRLCSGRVNNWRRLGGNDVKVILIGSKLNSPTGRVWRKLLMKQDLDNPEKNDITTLITPEKITVNNLQGQISMLQLPGAIVAGSWELAREKNKKYKLLKVNNVYPSRENILNNTYLLAVKYSLLYKADSVPEKLNLLADFLRHAAAADGSFIAL